MGSIRQRGQGTWLLDFYEKNGRRRRETFRGVTKQEAERILKQLEGDVARGRPLFSYADKLTFDALAKDFVSDYEVNRKRSLEKARKTAQKLSEVSAGGGR